MTDASQPKQTSSFNKWYLIGPAIALGAVGLIILVVKYWDKFKKFGETQLDVATSLGETVSGILYVINLISPWGWGPRLGNAIEWRKDNLDEIYNEGVKFKKVPMNEDQKKLFALLKKMPDTVIAFNPEQHVLLTKTEAFVGDDNFAHLLQAMDGEIWFTDLWMRLAKVDFETIVSNEKQAVFKLAAPGGWVVVVLRPRASGPWLLTKEEEIALKEIGSDVIDQTNLKKPDGLNWAPVTYKKGILNDVEPSGAYGRDGLILLNDDSTIKFGDVWDRAQDFHSERP